MKKQIVIKTKQGKVITTGNIRVNKNIHIIPAVRLILNNIKNLKKKMRGK